MHHDIECMLIVCLSIRFQLRRVRFVDLRRPLVPQKLHTRLRACINVKHLRKKARDTAESKASCAKIINNTQPDVGACKILRTY